MLQLQRYNLNVLYKKGKEMHIADLLSRAALPLTTHPEERSEETVYAVQAEVESVDHEIDPNISSQTWKSIKLHSQDDKTTGQEFQDFARSWEFQHKTSSLYNSQSNEKAESAVKISKTLISKAKQEGSDVWKAVLAWQKDFPAARCNV
ncbi:hypothetical protein SKAU_G00061780 [Synaphobranchus kaupii]|uniref:Integrase catalytic domain-containing protein n=1 Tax=Synaphobranchus kaupii TaxID=118154 RepID=A0A9Q1G5V7_SYNKA|nr:hypothetical protein SKAU_G00061780 [Synaphobranchus kaupii]